MLIFKNIYHPSRHQKVILLDIFSNQDKNKKPVIIFTHGYKSFKDWGSLNLIASYFARKGFIFIKYNLSHNGTTIEAPDKIIDTEAFGKNTIEIELDDLEEMIDRVEIMNEIADPYIDRNKIYLLGHSRGGSNSILKASMNEKVKKLVTWAAFNDYVKTWQRFYNMSEWKEKGVIFRDNKLTGEPMPLYYSLYLNYLKNEKDYNLKSAIKRLQIPFLAIHGMDDEYISYEEVLEMKRWNSNVVFDLMPYCNHNFGGYHRYEKNTLPEDTLIACDETIKFFNK